MVQTFRDVLTESFDIRVLAKCVNDYCKIDETLDVHDYVLNVM